MKKIVVLIVNVEKNYAKNLNTFANVHLKGTHGPPLFKFLKTPLTNGNVIFYRVNGPITVTDPVIGTVLKYRYFVKLFESHY